MKLLLLVPLLLCLAACQSNPTTPAAVGAASPEPASQQPAKDEVAQPEQPSPEYIEWRMLTINGKHHGELSTKLLTSQLGLPDSVAKGAVECGGELETLNSADGDFWYYGKTQYEVNGTRAVLSSFDVTTGKFQGKLGKLVLDQKTTLEDVRRFFPVSADKGYGPATGRPGEEMSLPFYYEGKPADAYLYLFFKQGRLQEVEFWYPC